MMEPSSQFEVQRTRGKTVQTQEMQPNLFELQGEVTKIAYSSISLDGKPRFTYVGTFGHHEFVGDEIGQSDTEIGRMITVQVLATRPETTTLTVLIPTFSFEKESTPFTTWAIFTTYLGFYPPVFAGALQTYTMEKLTGDALYVLS